MAFTNTNGEKKILTRVLLKNDTSTNWDTHQSVLLKKGEAALSFVENEAGVPDVMMKVGDGTHNFGQLNWLSALAADVHPWAKLSLADFVALETHTGDAEIEHTRVVSGSKISCTTKHTKHISFTGATAGGELTPAHTGYFEIVVPKLTFNEYGHLTAGEDKTYKITLPDVPEYTVSVLGGTNEATIGLEKDTVVVDTFKIVGDGDINVSAANDIITISYTHQDTIYTGGELVEVTSDKVINHTAPTGATAGAKGLSAADPASLTVVKGVTTDKFGHVTGVVTGDEHTTTAEKVGDFITLEDTGANGNHHYKIGFDSDALTTAIGSASTAAMVFKGCITTADQLNTALSTTTKTGDFYKIGQELTGVSVQIHAGGIGTTASTLHVGDAIVYDATLSLWHLIPAGDDIEDTWRPVYVNGESKADSSIGRHLDIVGGEDISVVADTTTAGKLKVTINNTREHDTSDLGDLDVSNLDTVKVVVEDSFAFDDANEDLQYKAAELPTKKYVDTTVNAAKHTHSGKSGTGDFVASVELTTDENGNGVLSATMGSLPVGTGHAKIATTNTDGSVTLKGGAVLNGHTLANCTSATECPDITLHKASVTGSIYDLEEVEADTVYLIFDCGSATTVI